MIRRPGLKLRSLMKREALLVPGAYDALTALLIEKHGFKAGYITGAGLSVSLLGKPDIGLLTMDEVAGVAKRIAAVTRVPFVVDADTGYGGELNVARAVAEFESAGVAGIQIEDQEFPKRCGHLSGKRVVPANEMVAKIRAAVAARKDKSFVIVARTDARGVRGLKDALGRAKLYKQAGADVIFPEALESQEEFAVFGRQKGLGVLMANMTEFGRSPALTVQELAHLGYRLVLAPMTAFRVAAFAIERALSRLRHDGSSRALLSQMQTRRELYKLNRYAEFDQREKDFLNQAKDRRKQ